MRKEVPEYCQVMRVKGPDGAVKELYFPKALDLSRPKRPRTTFSTAQLDVLESEFQANPYLVGKDRKRLASALMLSETQVKVWFQNRRTKISVHKKCKAHVDQPLSRGSTTAQNAEPPLKSMTSNGLNLSIENWNSTFVSNIPYNFLPSSLPSFVVSASNIQAMNQLYQENARKTERH
uniref:Homeobox domain-containing protein n=1 Tax=Ditylenchus dipsaci TaxID=166011 RepID=A0A915CT08_9BILA